jgi:zinc protease
VQVRSAPAHVTRLVDAVLAEVQRLQRSGPTEDDVQKIKETQKRDLETALRQNQYWLNSMQTLHLYGWDPVRISKRIERAESLTVENVHDALKKYFPTDRYTVVSLVPETR